MADRTLQLDASLPEALVARARGASDTRLALDVIGGAVAAVAFAGWQPKYWVAPFCAALCFAAFGAWGIADRELGERSTSGSTTILKALRLARVVAAVLGWVAAVALIFLVLGVALGRWIS